MRTFQILAPLLLTLVPAHGQSTPIPINLAGLENPTNIVDFNELALANGTRITDQYADFGITLQTYQRSRPGQNAGLALSGSGTPYAGFRVQICNNCIFNGFSVLFNSPTTEAVIQFTRYSTADVRAYLNGVEVDTFPMVPGYWDCYICTDDPLLSIAQTSIRGIGYLGFTDILFDEIRVMGYSSTNGDDAQLYSVQFMSSSVPEPATLALFGLGLAGIGFSWRRKAS